MDELQMLEMLCAIAIEQDKQITKQEAAIKNLSDEVSEILGILVDGAEQLPADGD